MSTILVKIFATALVLGQVTTKPDAVRTEFDPVRDQRQVVQILRDGCGQMKKAFDIEDINLDDLIATAMDDPQALTADIKALRGLSFGDLITAYRQFCKNEAVEKPAVDLAEVIRFYNQAVADLPDHATLKDKKLPGATIVLDGAGEKFTEVFEPEHRRVWVRLSDIPEHVQKAFVAAEDKRFFQHKGIDERGLIRAFIGNLTAPGRPQGGSTITQQVAKNLLVGADVTYERKMREIILASRIERSLTKADILELYLNSIYLGRGSWGVEMAARSYFGKPAKDLDIREGALLAGVTKGPNYFNPERHPARARERVAYVLNRMKEDGALDGIEPTASCRSWPATSARAGTPATTCSTISCARRRRPPGSTRSRPPPTCCVPPFSPSFSVRPKPPCRRDLRVTSSTPGGCASRARRLTLRRPSSVSPARRCRASPHGRPR